MLIIRLCHKDFILDISLCIYFKVVGKEKTKRVKFYGREKKCCMKEEKEEQSNGLKYVKKVNRLN